ncbi:hypothetical protein [Corynebacterium ulceribovis]|uniref:hypothetical protein n=1 Tax=Corynebacterium ulceribovis TaxID=487732 RepID=UPI0012EA1561|nr:hypothetical protein [Corynebacterium ulceribovis]
MTKNAELRIIGGGQEFRKQPNCKRVEEQIHREHVTFVDERRTAVLAKAAFDECRSRAPRGTKRPDLRGTVLAVEGALNCGASREEMLKMPDLYPRVHGRKHFAEALQVCHGFCESPGEALTKVALIEAGFGFHQMGVGSHRVLEQVEIRTSKSRTGRSEFVARVDFYVPALGLAIEFDGATKYQRSAVVPDSSSQRTLMTREIHRERAIRALGCDVLRVEWSEVLQPNASFREKVRKVVEARELALRNGAAEFIGEAYFIPTS